MNTKHNRYVVQVFSNVDGWQNTRYASDWLSVAVDAARKLCLTPGCFIGSKVTPVRVIDTKTDTAVDQYGGKELHINP